MKKIHLLFFLLPFCVFAQNNFVLGVEWLNPWAHYDDDNYSIPAAYWDSAKAFGINFGSITCNRPNHIQSDLNALNSRSINVELDDCHAWASPFYCNIKPLRWVYQAEGSNDLIYHAYYTNGSDRDAEQNYPDYSSNYSYNYSHFTPPNSETRILSNLRTAWYDHPAGTYYIKVRIRFPQNNGGTSAPNQVLKIVIKDSTTQQIVDSVFLRPRVYNTNWAELSCPAIMFDTNNCKSKYEIQIFSETNTPFDIDYLCIDSETSFNLHNGQYDYAIAQLANSVNYSPNIKFLKIADEILRYEMYPIRYTVRKLQHLLDSLGHPDVHPFFYINGVSTDTWHENMNETLYLTEAKVLRYDHYFTNIDLPVPSYCQARTDDNYLGLLQYKISIQNKYCLAECIYAAKKKNIPFWFTTQADAWRVGPTNEWFREPSVYETEFFANLGFCYGAKGITYYLYSTPTNQIHGILDIDLCRTNDEYGMNKWNILKNFNRKVTTIGNALYNFTWDTCFQMSNGLADQNTIAGTYIDSIRSYYTTNNGVSWQPEAVDNTFLSLALYHNPTTLQQYFFVLNRRTWDGDQRKFRIYCHVNDGETDIHEIDTTGYWLLMGGVTYFETIFKPGEGKLFSFYQTGDKSRSSSEKTNSVSTIDVFPNPFNPTTQIKYTLGTRSNINITLYSMLGQKIKVLEEGIKGKGDYIFNLDMNKLKLSSGRYFIVFNYGDNSINKKILFLK